MARQSKPIYLPRQISYQYTKKASKPVLMNMAKFLNSRFPGVSWVIMTSAEIAKVYGTEVAYNKAFFKTSGNVVINSDKATIETPFHEFGHIYLQYLKEEDIDAYNELIENAKAHSLFETMKKTYTKISDIDVAEEVVCELFSMSAADKLMLEMNAETRKVITGFSDTTGLFGRAIRYFKDLIKWVFRLPKTKPIDLQLSGSLKTFIETLSDDVLFGEGSIMNDFSEETREAVIKSRSSATFTIKEARAELMSRGYIELFCS